MNVNLLRKVPIALAVAASATAYGAMDMDSRVTELEHQMQQVRTETAMDNYGALTAHASPETTGAGWFIDLAVLYEDAYVNGLEYCYTDDDNVTGNFPIKGDLRQAKLSWDWGVEVGLGMNLEHDNWDVYAHYMHYKTSKNSKTSGHSCGNGSAVPLLATHNIIEGDVLERVGCANSNASFAYDTVSLELGRNFFVSSKLSLRPFYGLESTWLDIHQDTRYEGGDVPTNEAVYVTDQSDYWGMGARVGANTKWHLGYGFSIFGNVVGSLLYGNFDVLHKETYSLDQANRLIKLNGDMHGFVPVVRYFVGIAYDAYLDNNRHHVGLSLGYDATYMWRVNQMIRPRDNALRTYDRVSDDAGMQGVKLDFRWDF